jgi:hypothetical protein
MSEGLRNTTTDIKSIRGRATDQQPPRDFIRERSLSRDRLERKRNELATITSLHLEFRKLRRDNKKTNDASTKSRKSIESLQREKERIREDLDKVEKDLDELQQSDDFSGQRGIIEKIQYLDADTKRRMISGLENLSRKVKAEGIKYLSITELKEVWNKLVECAYTYIKEGKDIIIHQIATCDIEIRGDFDAYIDRSKPSPLKDVKGYIEIFERSIEEYFRSSDEQLERVYYQARKNAWNKMELTAYFQKKVKFHVDNRNLRLCIPILTDAIAFVKNSETPRNQERNQEFFKRKVTDTKEALKQFNANLRELSETEENVPTTRNMDGFREANDLYRALLNKQKKALASFQKKDALQAKLDDNKKNLTTDEREHIQRCIQFLDTAIADLQEDEQVRETNSKAYTSYMETMKGKTYYKEIDDIYSTAQALHTEQEKSDKANPEFAKRIEENNRKIAKVKIKQTDDNTFNETFQTYLKAGLGLGQMYLRLANDCERLLMHHNYLLNSIEGKRSQTQERIVGIEEYIRSNIILQEENAKRKGIIEERINMIRDEDVKKYRVQGDETAITHDWFEKREKQIKQEIDDLISQQEETRSDPGLREMAVKDNGDPTSIPFSQETARQEGASEQSLQSLENPEVADYTNALRKTYFKRYGSKIDINNAVASAKFLSDQNLMDPRKNIEIAADLIHEFRVGLDRFFLDRGTLEVVISDPDTKQFDLAPLKLSKFGSLLLDGKKLKSSVLASQVGAPHRWILAIRNAQAFGRRLFASKTAMQPSGNVDFADLRKLRRNNMNVAKIAIEREFGEEAIGYELEPETIQFSTIIYTPNECVVVFDAKAKESGKPVTISENMETTDVLILDIRELIKNNNINDINFSDRKVKRALLGLTREEFDKQNPEDQDLSRREYDGSYNVRYMVGRIREVLEGDRRSVQEPSWRFRGDEQRKWKRFQRSRSSSRGS